MTPERLAELRVLCAHGLTFAELNAARKAEARIAALPELLDEVERLRKALVAAKSVLWMAERYADAGGSAGPEMRDFCAVKDALAALGEGCDHASFNMETGCCAVCGFNFAPLPLDFNAG